MDNGETMMSTQHTPTPWRYFKQGDSTRFHITATPKGSPGSRFTDFATVDISHEADAAHIVRCVNSHDALVEALERLMRSWLAMHNSKSCEYSGDHPIAIARAALQAATEQS